jgi:integrase
VGKVRSILLQILRRARADGLDVRQIDRALVRLPREEVARREPRHITAEQLLRIIEASPSPWRELFALQGLAGLRISEALGLRWDDLDLTHGSAVMRVRQGAQGRELRPLKTATSRADVPLSDDLAGMLRVYQATWRPNDRQLLFATRTGMPIDAGYARRRHWQPLLQRLGIPSCGFHALRHGLPRRLFTAGVSANMVKALMRHGSLAVTERYSHHAAEDLRAAIHRVAQPRPAVTQAPATSRRFR